MIHSDQSSQFDSDEFASWHKDNFLSHKIIGKDNCWDNAITESLFNSLKGELIKKKVYLSRSVAKSEIFKYIDKVYKLVRRHKHPS